MSRLGPRVHSENTSCTTISNILSFALTQVVFGCMVWLCCWAALGYVVLGCVAVLYWGVCDDVVHQCLYFMGCVAGLVCWDVCGPGWGGALCFDGVVLG